MRVMFLLIAGVLAWAPATVQPAVAAEVQSYGCNDLVVVGRMQNLSFEHVEIADDILGHGWFSAHVKVRRALKGRAPEPVVSIRYFAHTYMREDRDFILDLKAAGGDVYELREATLLARKQIPHLAAACGGT